MSLEEAYSKNVWDGLNPKSQEMLLHIGVKYRSGRYEYGSGEVPFQHDARSFLASRKGLQKEGLTEKEIAEFFGISQNQLRSKVSVANEEVKRLDRESALSKYRHGKSINEIAEDLDRDPQWVRRAIKQDENTDNKKQSIKDYSNLLADRVNELKYLDVGAGVEEQLGVARTKMNTIVRDMVDSGEYVVHKIGVKQVTNPTESTTMSVLTKKDVTAKEVWENQDKIRSLDITTDGDAYRVKKIQTPKSINSDRVAIRYAIPEGGPGHGTSKDGAMMDGAMFIRPGTKDLNLGNSKYAQVRIAVDGTHYLKGMALYGDAKMFPKGTDIIFNTNKTKDVSKLDVLKPLERKLTDDNPFKAAVTAQNKLLGDDGKPVIDLAATRKAEKALGHKLDEPVYKTGAVNIISKEGDWNNWSKALSSQFLSKQPRAVVHERLSATLKKTDQEYDEISKVSNPVIKKQLLESYSSGLEAKQIHLKAVAPKGFQGHVLLPVPNMKENEVYAPNYKNGEKVILVRYPHAGRFEIPELTVNNNGPGRKTITSKAKDAIGIHPSVAAKLSGADFDGDVAYVIPNNSGKFKAQHSLAGLKGFDPKQYKDKPGTFTPITKEYKNKQMGIVSNLITDMTMQGASSSEMERAVRHSMVVIDSEKHKLNWKRSARDNHIDQLVKKYQGHVDKIDYANLQRFNPRSRQTETVTDIAKLKNNLSGRVQYGASTVISRRKQDVSVNGHPVTITDKNGKQKTVLRGSHKSYITAMVKDASVYLNANSSSVEKEYVDYINNLKSRKSKIDAEIKSIKLPKRNAKSAQIYKEEVMSLNEKLTAAKLNAPRERQAQILANRRVDKYIRDAGGKDAVGKDELKRVRNQAITQARLDVGAKRKPVKITTDEWDAIQANAISATHLRELVARMDDAELKELATPRPSVRLTNSRISKAQQLIANGYTYAEVASNLGVSVSTLKRYME